MTESVSSPIVILVYTGNFTKGEIYDVLTEDGENIYLMDDEGRYCWFSKKENGELWRYATDQETYSRNFEDIERFSQYQLRARATAIYPEQGRLIGLLYVALGLAGEAGEVANKTQKLLRDNAGKITEEYIKGIQKELGDVLWYISNMCDELGIDLKNIAQENIEKLYSRKERDKLHGDGDDR